MSRLTCDTATQCQRLAEAQTDLIVPLVISIVAIYSLAQLARHVYERRSTEAA